MRQMRASISTDSASSSPVMLRAFCYFEWASMDESEPSAIGFQWTTAARVGETPTRTSRLGDHEWVARW